MVNAFLLVADPSGLGAIWDALVNSAFAGNYIFLGLLLLIGFVYFVTIARIKAGGVVVTGLGMIYLLTVFNPAFKFLYYLAIIVSVIVLVMGVKNSMR